VLCAVGGLNIVAWALSAAYLRRRRALLSPQDYRTHYWQLLLSAGYVFGCAFRSMFPVYVVPRVGLFDSWLCSAIVDRSVATCAELCFAMQWALLLREISRATGSGVGRVASAVAVPLIAVAELCSWYSVLTTSNLGHVLEESIWALAAALLVASFVAIWPRSSAALRPLLAAWCAAGIAYVAFMFMVDVPMYWSRWLADVASGHVDLSIAQGLLDASQHLVVSHSWEIWKHEMPWMSLYFSVAVWMSIALVHVRVRNAAAPARVTLA